MCNYKKVFANKPEQVKPCYWENFFLTEGANSDSRLKFKTLPHDTDGWCLFHSSNINWKRKQNFWDRLKEIISILDEEHPLEEISFYDCHFIGIVDELSTQLQYHEETTTPHTIDIDRVLLKTKLCFFNCTFHDAIHIERTIFRRGLVMQGCTFLEGVNVFGSSFGDEFQLSSCVFEKNISFWQATEFFGEVVLLRNHFKDKVDFHECYFHEINSVDENVFDNEEEPVSFEGYFKKGISFRTNQSLSLVVFSNCWFVGNTLFYNNDLSQFHLENPMIEGSIAFVGREDKLLFNAHSIIEIEDELIKQNGQVIFDYCNLLNLGSDFLNHVQGLELSQKVSILPNCKVDRLTIVYQYPHTKLNEWVIDDMARLIQKYFDYYFSIHLRIDIQRKLKQNLLQLTFRTSEKISEAEFRSRLRKFENKLSQIEQTKDVYEQVLIDTLQELKNRVQRIKQEDQSLIAFGDRTQGLVAQAMPTATTTDIHDFQTVPNKKNYLKDLLKKNRLRECIKLMESHFDELNETTALNQVITQASMFTQLNEQKRFNIIDIFEFNRGCSTIQYHLLGIIDDFIEIH